VKELARHGKYVIGRRKPGEKRVKHRILEVLNSYGELTPTQIGEFIGMTWWEFSGKLRSLITYRDIELARKSGNKSYYRITKQGKRKLAYFDFLWDGKNYKGKPW